MGRMSRGPGSESRQPRGASLFHDGGRGDDAARSHRPYADAPRGEAGVVAGVVRVGADQRVRTIPAGHLGSIAGRGAKRNGAVRSAGMHRTKCAAHAAGVAVGARIGGEAILARETGRMDSLAAARPTCPAWVAGLRPAGISRADGAAGHGPATRAWTAIIAREREVSRMDGLAAAGAI